MTFDSKVLNMMKRLSYYDNLTTDQLKELETILTIHATGAVVERDKLWMEALQFTFMEERNAHWIKKITSEVLRRSTK